MSTTHRRPPTRAIVVLTIVIPLLVYAICAAALIATTR